MIRRSNCTVECTGKVVSRKKTKERYYQVAVEYVVDGKKYRITEVSKLKYKRVNVGGISLKTCKVYSQPDMLYSMSVPVLYNPGNPSEAFIKGNIGLSEMEV